MSRPDPLREDLAVIGFAGRFPGARSLDEFWRHVRDGVESVTFFADDELQPGPLDGPLPPDDPGVVKARALLAQPEWFDAAFFGLHPREAELIDPQHRLLLECAWEALEHAGVNPDTCPGSIGVFAGASLNTYLLANVLPEAAALRRAGGLQALLASDKDFLTTRISYKLNLRGPSLTVQTACSTSLVAVSLACQHLLGYQCDLALAGGAAVAFPQKKGLRHQEGGLISPDGHCRPFDADAAGTVSGDGVGLVVLKRLSEALADGDPIHAVVRGCAVNNDGAQKIGYTAPSAAGQAEVVALALAQAGVAPESISYVETQGLGTPLGDALEIAALTQAFTGGPHPARATGTCALGATKANIGHLDAAAGIAGFIKTVLALEHRQLPPVLHFRRPNPNIDFAHSPFYVNDRLRDWPAQGGLPRRAGVSSFGIGGTNAHVVLEEAPALPPSPPAAPWQLLVLSARTPAALDAATANLAQHLEAHPGLNLADVAWTLQTGRKPFAHRRALVCRDAADAVDGLRGAAGAGRLLTGGPAGTTGEVPSFLAAQARLWLAGVAVDWSAGRAGRRRVPLPTYPFERQRCWIEPPTIVVPSDPGLHQRNGAAPAAAAPPTATAPAVAPEAGTTVARLRALFHEWSGADLAGAPAQATFHELGFDSLFLAQASLAVKEHFGAEVSLRQLHDQFPTLEKLAAHLEQSRPDRASAPVAPRPPPPAAAPAAPASAGSAPLTEAQREIWFAAQLGAGVSAAYNESCTVHLHGRLDLAALRGALRQLLDRHEALRTTFSPTGDRQHFAATCPGELPVADFSGLPEASARTAQLTALSEGAVEAPFDLVRGPLWRIRLARLSGERHALVLVVHHLICDGWSLHRLVHELGELYTARRRGEAAGLPPPAQFSTYVQHLAEQRSTPAFAAAEAYWLGRFADAVPVLELPTDRPRPAARTYAGAHQRRALPPAVAAGVRQLGAEHGCTSFTVLLSGFCTLLHRLSGQDDLVVGVPAAAQILGGHRHLVGHCANLLPFRSRLGAGQTGADFLAATRRRVLDAFEHWQHPFGGLLRQLNLPRDPNRVPLANVTFNLARLHGGLRFGEADAALATNPGRFVNFDLSCNVTEADGALALDCFYSTELFDDATIARLLERYEFLLATAAAGLARPVHEQPLLLPDERQQLTAGWNRTATAYPREQCLHEMFEEQARRTPEATALVHGEERWTYRELNRRANQVAHRLRRLGVWPDTLVGLCAARTPLMVAGVLGILKAGGAYVPLDPAYPAARLAFMLADADVRVLLTLGTPRFPLPPSLPPAAVLRLDDDWSAQFAGARPTDPHSGARPGHLAYVIYTSGSTGRPKGVALEHRGTVAFVHWAHGLHTAGELRGVLASTSLCFDLSVFELFVPLTCGGTVILADNALQLPALPARDEVTLINTVPSAIAELLRTGGIPASVRTVNLAGEPLATPLVRQLYALPSVRKVYDLYGPTETTTYSTCALRRPDGPATIGRPIANTQVHLLDRHRQPVPPGVPGELWIGGAGLARGYLNQPGLTAEKFPTLSVGDAPLARCYRTGDLARRRPDGSLEYLGRLDQQVKVRGYRIEPGEIATVLARHPGVHECVVVAREDAPGDRRLVAYLTAAPGADPDRAELRATLARALPDYMVPSAFVRLERLPRTPNGKLDRRALPAPEPPRPDRTAADAAPRTPTEEVLAGIWCAVLGLKQVGIHDNFFDLGGHSLLVTQVLARVRESFEVTLSLRAAFDAPTLHSMAALIEHTIMSDVARLGEEEASQLLVRPS